MGPGESIMSVNLPQDRINYIQIIPNNYLDNDRDSKISLGILF